jgi:hypothetical protein
MNKQTNLARSKSASDTYPGLRSLLLRAAPPSLPVTLVLRLWERALSSDHLFVQRIVCYMCVYSAQCE